MSKIFVKNVDLKLLGKVFFCKQIHGNDCVCKGDFALVLHNLQNLYIEVSRVYVNLPINASIVQSKQKAAVVLSKIELLIIIALIKDRELRNARHFGCGQLEHALNRHDKKDALPDQ